MACNFENGRRAGERLLRLFADLNGTVTDPQGTLIPAPSSSCVWNRRWRLATFLLIFGAVALAGMMNLLVPQ